MLSDTGEVTKKGIDVLIEEAHLQHRLSQCSGQFSLGAVIIVLYFGAIHFCLLIIPPEFLDFVAHVQFDVILQGFVYGLEMDNCVVTLLAVGL